MTDLPTIEFARKSAPKKGAAMVLSSDGKRFGALSELIDPAGALGRAAAAVEFTGKAKAGLEVLAPEASALDRIIALGTGHADKFGPTFWVDLGGVACARADTAAKVAVALELDGVEVTAANAADFAQGWLLRAYEFKKYKTVKKDDENGAKNGKPKTVTIMVDDHGAAKKAFAEAEAIAAGVLLARDLVNEPANALGPVEFANIAKGLTEHGVEVEILTEKKIKKLGMNALLGVSQGSVRPPRLAVMKWMGGKAKDKPVAFIGKGVVFDTGGISIKPAASMEDMKGDMGGAAAVTGLMRALAGRKAKVNAIGIIGLVENMPDGAAQRPGDIVTSMSGQTIEIINTDAEGRLVLCDALWYCNETFKPKFMINLATLTGAIIIALGQNHAGLFCNDDALAGQLSAAGEATGEKVWRMPLGAEYDKLIDSKFADMKNTGGRNAGSITAAQFLKRFVKETPWAHLDIAGTAMSSPATDTNTSWGSGYGVRLLDRLVRDHCEG